MASMRHYSSLAIAALIFLVIVGFLISSKGLAEESRIIPVGKQVIQGMAISVELEEPKMMQMMMAGMGGMGGMGEWKTFRPKPGALTHHLTVVLTDPASRERIPYANVTATIINTKTKEKIENELPAMFGKNLIYGTNVFLKPGKYDLLVKVGPPSVMRIEGAFDKWLKPIEAKFSLEVN